ncbi:TPA: TMEM165/GDT1 family protein [Candidatus Woesearchaeota archaeon]|nr:TMEM165/GDT1 family protein [Candidatus Woesearchaeota archaeon]
MTPDFLIPGATIALAELGDKTMIAMIALSARYKKAHIKLLLGALLGFLFVDGAAILAGAYLFTFLPSKMIKLFAGFLFIGFGIYMLFFQKEEKLKKARDGSAFLAAFSLVMLTEMGDRTQIAAALFAVEYSVLSVLISTLVGIGLVTVLAIFIGQRINKYLKPKMVNMIAGIIFILVGIGSFFFT